MFIIFENLKDGREELSTYGEAIIQKPTILR